MKTYFHLFTLTVIFSILQGCEYNHALNKNNVDKGQNIQQSASHIDFVKNADSVKITELVRQVYKWHLTNNIVDFPYQYKNSDSIFSGMNWDNYENQFETLKKTGFFTSEFLSKHRWIAENLDASIKTADVKWRNINDGIPIWSTNADDWCGCQDYPDDYWSTITLRNLKITDDFARFEWTWNKTDDDSSFSQVMSAKKIKGDWKVNSVQGFNSYQTAEEYNALLND